MKSIFDPLFKFLAELFGTSVKRAMIGSGFALVTGVAFLAAIQKAITAATNNISGITGDLKDIILLAGVGDAVSLIFAAVLTRASWDKGQPIIRRISGGAE